MKRSARAFIACSAGALLITPAVALAAATAPTYVEMDAAGAGQYELRPVAGTPCLEKFRAADGVSEGRFVAPPNTPVSACKPTPTPTPSGTPTGAPPPLGVGDFDSEDLRSAPNPSAMFAYGLWHRDSLVMAQQSWPVRGCRDGMPATTATRANWMSSFTLCPISTSPVNFVLRTAVGDTAGYSVGWFTPQRVFTRADQPTVSWEVNLTDLRVRKWWEALIMPAGDKTHFLPKQDQGGIGTDCKACVSRDWMAAVFGGTPYAPQDIVVGNGPFGGGVNITTKGVNNYTNWRPVHGAGGWLTSAQSNGIGLFRFQVTDNMNGTLTVNYGGLFTQTVPGRFPDRYEVVFKDHSYTPSKDGVPANGYTWFWDKIKIS